MRIRGKNYDDRFIIKEKGYQQEVQNFIERFERENYISIRLREKDLEKAEKYVDEELKITDDEVRFMSLEFPFDTFELNGNNFRLYVHKEDDNGEFVFALLTKNRENVKFCTIFNSERGKYATLYGDLKDQYIPACAIAIKWVILYILGKKKTYIKSKERKAQKEIQKPNENLLEISKMRTHYISIDDAVCLCKTEPARMSRKIMCECYGVRGHYRHYKNGKIVFIKPYKKGTKRNEGKPVNQNYKI